MDGKTNQSEKIKTKDTSKGSSGRKNWKQTILKVYESGEKPSAFMNPDGVAEVVRGILAAEGDTRDQEHLWVLGLDGKKEFEGRRLPNTPGYQDTAYLPWFPWFLPLVSPGFSDTNQLDKSHLLLHSVGV